MSPFPVIVRRGLLVLVPVLIGIQLIPVDRDNPPVKLEVEAPDEVQTILRRACYDCHSNETEWPWYSRVAPSSWLVAGHVHEGRGEMNFSEWPAFDVELQAHTLHDIEEQISEGKMPIRSYTLVHKNARLSREDREVLLYWARSFAGGE